MQDYTTDNDVTPLKLPQVKVSKRFDDPPLLRKLPPISTNMSRISNFEEQLVVENQTLYIKNVD